MSFTKSELYIVLGILIAGIFLLFSLEAYTLLSKGSGPESVKSEVNELRLSLAEGGHYSCCSSSPCTYCLFDEEHHGECDCMEDVIGGESPCPECIGNILSGNGKPALSRYFARALSDGLGSGSSDAIKKLVSEKYGISDDEQA